MGEKKIRRYFIHIALFLLTLLTTTIAGAEHATAKIFAGWGLIDQEFLLGIKDWTKGLALCIVLSCFFEFSRVWSLFHFCIPQSKVFSSLLYPYLHSYTGGD